MAILTSEIKFYLSGGNTNTNPTASLGGVISTTEVADAVTHNLFDLVTAQQATDGLVEYRCIYVKNTNAVDTWTGVEIYIQSQTTSTDTSLAVGLDPAGAGNGSTTGVATTVANETSAPSGVSFTQPTSTGRLAMGDIAAGLGRAVWLRRTVNAGAVSFVDDAATIQVIGGSPA